MKNETCPFDEVVGLASIAMRASRSLTNGYPKTNAYFRIPKNGCFVNNECPKMNAYCRAPTNDGS